jgi:Bacteriophage replication protein O
MTATPAPPAPAPPSLPPPEEPAFRGFRRPSYTMVPDELFDELLPDLSGAELKVLLFVIRRTFGFKRDADAISLSQMLHGVTTRDGRVLHRGVGLCKPTLLGALRSLQEKGVLLTARRRSWERGDEPTVYALRFAERAGQAADSPTRHQERPVVPARPGPVVKKVDQGGGQETAPGGWAPFLPTQQTGPRQTQEQHHPQTPAAPLEPIEGTLAPTSAADPESDSAGDDDALLDLLVSRGVTRRIAQELVRTHSGEAIRQQVAWQAHRPAAKSPAGALVQAIRDAWPPPPAWIGAREHAAAVARQAEEEAEHRAAEEAHRREWEAKPPEERIAGRLQFWLAGRRAKRHEPTAEEVAAKRAELLAQLAAAPSAAAAG